PDAPRESRGKVRIRCGLPLNAAGGRELEDVDLVRGTRQQRRDVAEPLDVAQPEERPLVGNRPEVSLAPEHRAWPEGCGRLEAFDEGVEPERLALASRVGEERVRARRIARAGAGAENRSELRTGPDCRRPCA